MRGSSRPPAEPLGAGPDGGGDAAAASAATCPEPESEPEAEPEAEAEPEPELSVPVELQPEVAEEPAVATVATSPDAAERRRSSRLRRRHG